MKHGVPDSGDHAARVHSDPEHAGGFYYLDGSD